MAYNINTDDRDDIINLAYSFAGIAAPKANMQETALYYAVTADVGAYINDDFTEDMEKPTSAPVQIVKGVIVPMLAARLAAGMQSVTTISEGGSSASLTPTYSANVGDYSAVLCRYKRLGYPKKGAAV